MSHSFIGISLPQIERFWRKSYNINKPQLDSGDNIPSVLYCHTPWFVSDGKWHMQDYSKVGKTKSVYNRIRSATQVGASPNLHWVIETQNNIMLEKQWTHYANNLKLTEDVALDTNATELFKLDCPYKQLEDFLKHINWRENYLVGRVIIFKDESNIEVITKKDWEFTNYYREFNRKPYDDYIKRYSEPNTLNALFEIN